MSWKEPLGSLVQGCPPDQSPGCFLSMFPLNASCIQLNNFLWEIIPLDNHPQDNKCFPNVRLNIFLFLVSMRYLCNAALNLNLKAPSSFSLLTLGQYRMFSSCINFQNKQTNKTKPTTKKNAFCIIWIISCLD